ncbi:MAG TPA: hypothetical protein VHF01_15060 [Candidatus Acidoferrum sp.]|nr:hypothetical protein [Candidatus Acidoferrum sp.]
MKLTALFIVLLAASGVCLIAQEPLRKPFMLPPDSDFSNALSVNFAFACASLQLAAGLGDKDPKVAQTAENAFLASLTNEELNKINVDVIGCFSGHVLIIRDESFQKIVANDAAFLADIRTEIGNREYNEAAGKYNALVEKYNSLLSIARSQDAQLRVLTSRQQQMNNALAIYSLMPKIQPQTLRIETVNCTAFPALCVH